MPHTSLNAPNEGTCLCCKGEGMIESVVSTESKAATEIALSQSVGEGQDTYLMKIVGWECFQVDPFFSLYSFKNEEPSLPPSRDHNNMGTLEFFIVWRGMLVGLLVEASGGALNQRVDGGIPLTLGISCLIFFVGFLVLLFIRNDMHYLYCPRIWSKG